MGAILNPHSLQVLYSDTSRSSLVNIYPGSWSAQYHLFQEIIGFPGGSDGQESTCNVGDLGLIPGLGRSLGEGNGNPLQYSCLENPMDRGAWWATVHGVTKSWTQLSTAQHDVWKCIRGFPLGLVEEVSLNSIFCFTFPPEAEMEFTLGGSFKQDLNGKKG